MMYHPNKLNKKKKINKYVIMLIFRTFFKWPMSKEILK